jgi:hypothetical protein
MQQTQLSVPRYFNENFVARAKSLARLAGFSICNKLTSCRCVARPGAFVVGVVLAG